MGMYDRPNPDADLLARMFGIAFGALVLFGVVMCFVTA